MFGWKLIKESEYKDLLIKQMFKDSEICNLRFNNRCYNWKRDVYYKVAETFKYLNSKMFNKIYKNIIIDYPKPKKEPLEK